MGAGGRRRGADSPFFHFQPSHTCRSPFFPLFLILPSRTPQNEQEQLRVFLLSSPGNEEAAEDPHIITLGCSKLTFLQGTLQTPHCSYYYVYNVLHSESFHHHFVRDQGLHWNGDTLIIKLNNFMVDMSNFSLDFIFTLKKLTITFSLMIQRSI